MTSIWAFLNNRIILFILFIFSLNISMIGPPSVPIKSAILALDISLLYDTFTNAESIYRMPDSLLRFTFFLLSLVFFFLIIYSKHINYKKPSSISYITSFLMLAFLISILVTDDIYNYIAVLLILLSFIYLILYRKILLTNLEILLISTYIIMFIIPFWSSLLHTTSFSETDNYLRFFLVIPVYLIIREVEFTPLHLYLSINIASILIGLFAIYCAYLIGEIRVRGFSSSAVIFGNISLLFSFFSFLTIQKYIDNYNSKLLPIIASMLAFYGWILSGSRGSLLFVLIFMVLLLSSHYRRHLLLSKKIIFSALLLIPIIFFNSSISTRFSNAYESTYNYFIDGSGHYWKHSDSIVPRMNIWKASLLMIEKNYYTGVGLDNFNHSLEREITLKNIQPIRSFSDNPTAGMNHAHNQYLDIFAKTGIFGLISLLIFISFHIFFFYHAYSQAREDEDIKYISLIGITSIVGYSLYMLFHCVFSHQQSILFMSILLIILSGIISKRLRDLQS